MAIRFDTTEYEAAHARKPRGRGAWCFELKTEDGKVKKAITPPGFMTYTEAKAEATRMLRELGYQDMEISVCS